MKSKKRIDWVEVVCGIAAAGIVTYIWMMFFLSL